MAGSKDEKGQSDSITSPFDTIRHMDGEREYWSARDMAKLLGYSEYSKFKNVIRKAEIACKNCGRAVSDHFVYVRNESQIGKDARRKREDVHLSRYACYMLVQSADPTAVCKNLEP